VPEGFARGNRSPRGPRGRGVAFAALLLAFAFGVSGASAAPTGLVVDGSQIVDAATFDAAKKEGRLLLYSTFEPGAMKKVLAAFQSDTGLSVDAMRLTSQPMYERATAEYSAHKLPADFVDTTDITLTDELAQKGILVPYQVPGLRDLPAVLHDPGGRWYTIIRSLIVVGVNTSLSKPSDLPATWNDLLDPKWKGKIGFASIDAGGSAYSLYFFLRQRFGLDYWKRLAAQNGRIEPTASPVMTDLARGDTSVALDPQESMLTTIATGAPIKIVYPSGGVPAFGISGGVTSTAPHPNAARVWLAWITSKRGSTVLANGGSYGINRGAPTPTAPGLAMPPAGDVYNIRASDYNRTREAYTKEWHDIFNVH
jgi:iron(III) transport system substrate-binding protein